MRAERQIKELEWGIGDNIVAEAVFARQKIQGFIKVSISSVNKIAGKGGVAGGTWRYLSKKCIALLAQPHLPSPIGCPKKCTL
jgi:hypothetical protein